jgi:hypothetical protein
MRAEKNDPSRKEAIQKAARREMRAAMALGPSNLTELVEEQLVRSGRPTSKDAMVRLALAESWAADDRAPDTGPTVRPTAPQPPSWASDAAAIDEAIAKAGPMRVALGHLVDLRRAAGDGLSLAELALVRSARIPSPNVIGSRAWADVASGVVHRARKEAAVLDGFGVREALQMKVPAGATWGGPAPSSGLVEGIRQLLDREAPAETPAAPTDETSSATSSVSGTSESWSSRR